MLRSPLPLRRPPTEHALRPPNPQHNRIAVNQELQRGTIDDAQGAPHIYGDGDPTESISLPGEYERQMRTPLSNAGGSWAEPEECPALSQNRFRQMRETQQWVLTPGNTTGVTNVCGEGSALARCTAPDNGKAAERR